MFERVETLTTQSSHPDCHCTRKRSCTKKPCPCDWETTKARPVCTCQWFVSQNTTERVGFAITSKSQIVLLVCGLCMILTLCPNDIFEIRDESSPDVLLSPDIFLRQELLVCRQGTWHCTLRSQCKILSSVRDQKSTPETKHDPSLTAWTSKHDAQMKTDVCSKQQVDAEKATEQLHLIIEGNGRDTGIQIEHVTVPQRSHRLYAAIHIPRHRTKRVLNCKKKPRNVKTSLVYFQFRQNKDDS